MSASRTTSSARCNPESMQVTPTRAATLRRCLRKSNDFEHRSLQQRRDIERRIDGVSVEHEHGELIAAPASQHAFDGRSHLLEAPRGLDDQLVARGMAERVVDELEAIDVDEHDREALTAPRAHLASARDRADP